MTIRELRCKMSLMVVCLIQKAQELGFEVAVDEWTNHQNTGHKQNSLHYLGLAIDLLLYLNGVYLTKTEDYKALGEYWESIGGTWGGRFGDGNHFSIEYNGVK